MSNAEDRQFVRDYEGLVRSIATKLCGELSIRGEADDLMAFGFVGLMEARKRYDPERGVQFSTFAYYRVRGAILDGIAKMARLPRAVHRRRVAAAAIDQTLEAHGETRASNPDGRNVHETLQAMDAILGQVTAIHMMAAVGQGEESSAPPADELVLAADQQREIREAIETLPEREKRVVRGMYFEDRTLEQIGSELGISKSWTSRIHTRAVQQIREYLDREP